MDNTKKQLDTFRQLVDKGATEVYYGIDAYTIPLQKRIEVAQSPIKQIINGEMVADYHKVTDDLVNRVIASRVDKGLSIKNLIRQADSNLEIEKSNPDTLKETRLLPEGFELEGIFTVFGDYVSFISMEMDQSVGIIVNNKIIAGMFHNIFDTVWEASKPF
ncbi:hypothetical protein KC909_00700 [Candidatus Dojkabacteria bacterium]|uniref:Uncharacterized protein n=1 Tax=Candidatus Dojkabacteria bacterium TaxID=2099670 RepID=A0A955RIY0_9BACT|nr:hypothetical protein [Candidatus Dojkabacteria bacterium]